MGDLNPYLGAIALVAASYLTYLGVRFTARQTRRAHAEASEVSLKSQEWQQRDAFIDRLMKAQESQGDRIAALEARMVEADRREDSLWRHIDVMEAHIWRGQGPPPPPRPTL